MADVEQILESVTEAPKEEVNKTLRKKKSSVKKRK